VPTLQVPVLKSGGARFAHPRAVRLPPRVSVAIGGAGARPAWRRLTPQVMRAASAAHPHWVSSPKANKRHGVLLAGPAATSRRLASAILGRQRFLDRDKLRR